MIKANGAFSGFFDRPLAAALGAVTIAVWLIPAVVGLLSHGRAAPDAPHPSDHSGS